MKFRHSALLVLITAAVAVITLVSVVSTIISSNMSDDFASQQFVLMEKIVNSKFSGAERIAISAAEAMAVMPDVKKAFAERKRDELLAATKDTFKVLQEKHGISQAQFHVAPATSFLRLHNPTKFDDDQAVFRQIVVEVNRTKEIRKGIEVTTSGIGVFGTLPMTDAAGQTTGSFEMGVEIGPLLDQLKKSYGFELAVYIDEKILRETATSLKGDVYSDDKRVGPYITFLATHPALMREIVGSADVNFGDSSNYVREAHGVPQGVVLLPLFNYAKKKIGVVAVARNFSATNSASGRAIVWQAMLGLLSIVVLIGVILSVVRGMLVRPLAVLGERVNALADGKEARELPDVPGWSEEMRALASDCDRLARRAEQNDEATGGKA
ncbi:MAG: cache domain-containing protein [Pseudomonadota bacterium]